MTDICSFFLRGLCNKAACPFLHEGVEGSLKIETKKSKKSKRKRTAIEQSNQIKEAISEPQPSRTKNIGDRNLTCCDCDSTFVFTGKNQAYFILKDYADPVRCRDCRQYSGGKV